MKHYYLDANAFSYLQCQDCLQGWTAAGASALRDAMAEATRDDLIALLGSVYHVEEASRIQNARDPDARRRRLAYLWSATGWLLLMPTDELVPAEGRSGGRLADNEPFVTAWMRGVIKQQTRSAPTLDAIAADVHTRVASFEASQRARHQTLRTRFATEYANLTPANVTRRWWQNAEAQIDDWTHDYMTQCAGHLGLATDHATWPAPRQLQSAWAFHAFHMAKVVDNIAGGRKVDDGDGYDAHHYVAACYADALVTNDRGFRATLALIPNQPVQLLNFNEFAAELGVAPH